MSSQALHTLKGCFSGSSWTPACRWEVVNEFLILPGLPVQLLLSLLNLLYFDLRVFLPSFYFLLSQRRGEGARGWVGVWLLVRVNPTQAPSSSTCFSSWPSWGWCQGWNYTLSLRSHKNLSLCALLCMNTPSKCPVSTDRISIAFSPQPIIWLDRMYALERKHSTQPIRTGSGQHGGTEKAEEYTDAF